MAMRPVISGILKQLQDMAEPMISGVLELLGSAAFEITKEEIESVKNVEKEIEKLESTFTAIQALHYDALRRRINEASVKLWLDKLEDVSYDIDDVLDEWITIINKANIAKEEQQQGENAPPSKKVCLSLCSSSSSMFNSPLYELVHRKNIGFRIKQLNERLDRVAAERNYYSFDTMYVVEQPQRPKTTTYVDVSKIYGRDEEKEVLIEKLLDGSAGQDIRELDIIAIVGMGGIGKTSLAQLLCKDEKIKVHFHKIIWVCVSDPFDEVRVAKAIIESLGGKADSVEMNYLLDSISKHIKEKKFLLILDDVWTKDNSKWEPLKEALKNGAAASRVLVTTRNMEVTKMMQVNTSRIIPIKVLSDENCWSIFKQLAFFDQNMSGQFEEIGRKIVSKCKGLPLVAKTLGSLMRSKKGIQQWNDVLNCELWERQEKDVEQEIFGPLMLSYEDLSPTEKLCLLYFSTFPKDYEIKAKDLITLWISQGYFNGFENLELEGESCYNYLVERSFIQEVRSTNIDDYHVTTRRCVMHDVMHDFILFLNQSPNRKKKTRHFTLLWEPQIIDVLSSIDKKESLRTLFVIGHYYDLNCDFLLKLPFLRTLDLSNNNVLELPRKMNELVHLRYLNLSDNLFLKELPDTLWDLYNLQTLNLKNCRFLVRLPKGIGKLVNLRHLYIEGCIVLKFLPKEIAKLSFLRTLDRFIVPYEGLNNDEALQFEDLSMLKHLQGSLTLDIWGNIRGDKRAPLKDREYLAQLSFNFTFRNSDDEKIFEYYQQRIVDHEIILEERLQPHPNLESLTISCYYGTAISPNWMMTLIHLKRLHLSLCLKCETLPPLGKLPSLESLKIDSLTNLKKVGDEFLTDNPSITQISFPKLKHLYFWRLFNWEDWVQEEEFSLRIMPCLQDIHISDCPRLKTLPHFLRNRCIIVAPF